MSKFLANDSDIPSSFNGTLTSKKMLDNIKSERKSHENELIAIEHPEQIPNIELTDDFKLARDNIEKLLELSTRAIEDYYEFATTSSSPKAVEVLSNMIRDTVEMNKSFIDIHHQRERINKTKIDNGSPVGAPDNNPTQNNITTQNNIMCSPGDLVKMMRDAAEGKDILP